MGKNVSRRNQNVSRQYPNATKVSRCNWKRLTLQIRSHAATGSSKINRKHNIRKDVGRQSIILRRRMRKSQVAGMWLWYTLLLITSMEEEEGLFNFKQYCSNSIILPPPSIRDINNPKNVVKLRYIPLWYKVKNSWRKSLKKHFKDGIIPFLLVK